MKALNENDPELHGLIEKEHQRQLNTLRLIASENYAWPEVMEACGSSLNNKYSEGYAKKRYYEGQEFIDQVETLAVERIKEVFGVDHANVQPYSGSPANLAAYFAFCEQGDTIMGMALPAGGHLTHGWKVTISGKHFNPVQYGVHRDTHLIDFDEVSALAKEHKPKLIFCGATAYPRIIDFAKFAEIANDVGAVLVADIAHISGLVAGGAHPSPVGSAPVITSTTHKTFRGPRGGMILSDAAHKKAVDRAVFPGLQGGPHNGTTAGIAAAAKRALSPEFKLYAQAIVDNARSLAEALKKRGVALVTGGTDNHLIVADLTPKDVPGKVAAQALDRAGIVCNYNSIPFDPRKPFDPSGIRIGTAALTSRNFDQNDMQRVGDLIADVIDAPEDDGVITNTKSAVAELTAARPVPGYDV